MPACLPSSPERCRSAACSGSLGDPPHYSPQRCHSGKSRTEGEEEDWKMERWKRKNGMVKTETKDRETRGVWVWFKWKWESFWTDVKHRCLFIPKQSRTGFGEYSSSPRKGKDVISVRICLAVSEDGKQIGHAHTQPHSLHNVFFHKQNTHAAKSIKNHQLSSKQDLQAQSHWRGREEVICSRSVSDSRAEELSSENCCPSFNSDTKPKQKPHQFGLITPPCCMWSTYGQFIYHKSQSTFYADAILHCKQSEHAAFVCTVCMIMLSHSYNPQQKQYSRYKCRKYWDACRLGRLLILQF